MFCLTPRTLPCRSNALFRSLRSTGIARAFHVATADFTNHGPHGSLVTSKVSIRIGDPGESYVMIPPEVGRAFRAAGLLSNGSALTDHPARSPLVFYHDTRHFVHSELINYLLRLLVTKNLVISESCPSYPRLVIPQDLSSATSTNTSPATLWHYGLMNTIALNGTFDGT